MSTVPKNEKETKDDDSAIAEKSAPKTSSKSEDKETKNSPPIVKMSKFHDHKHNLLVKKLFHFYLIKNYDLRKMCVEIKKQMDTRIGPSWQCVIGRDPDMVVRYHVREGVILVVENHPKKKPEQQLVLVAFRGSPDISPAPPTTNSNPSDDFDEKVATLKKRTRVHKTSLDKSSTQSLVEQLCLSAAEFPDDCKSMSLQLKARLTALHGPTWHVFASTSRLGYSISAEKEKGGKYVEVSLLDWNVVFFQHDQEQPADTTTCCFGILRKPRLSTLPLYGYVVAGACFIVYFFAFAHFCGEYTDLDDAPVYCWIPESTWGFLAFGLFISCYALRMVTRTVTKVRTR